MYSGSVRVALAMLLNIIGRRGAFLLLTWPIFVTSIVGNENGWCHR